VLPGCDINTLELFLRWTTCRELPNYRQASESFDKGSNELFNFTTTTQLQLIRLWTFADMILIPKLQNDSLQAINDMTAFTRAETIELIFATTVVCSTLQNYALDCFLSGHRLPTDYGPKRYSDQDFDRIGATPGVMLACFKLTEMSRCGSLYCECDPCCYAVYEAEDYMVPE